MLAVERGTGIGEGRVNRRMCHKIRIVKPSQPVMWVCLLSLLALAPLFALFSLPLVPLLFVFSPFSSFLFFLSFLYLEETPLFPSHSVINVL